MKKEYDFSKAKRGPVIPTPPGKVRVILTIDQEILDWLREQVNAAGGGDYSDIVNQAMEVYIKRSRGELAETLRQVIREEFAKGQKKRAVGK